MIPTWKMLPTWAKIVVAPLVLSCFITLTLVVEWATKKYESRQSRKTEDKEKAHAATGSN